MGVGKRQADVQRGLVFLLVAPLGALEAAAIAAGFAGGRGQHDPPSCMSYVEASTLAD